MSRRTGRVKSDAISVTEILRGKEVQIKQRREIDNTGNFEVLVFYKESGMVLNKWVPEQEVDIY